ncbi:uncharacterized protein [Zea mays]|nr:uncharacterized protein LOC103641998 isoform X2 [Zea mays]|eukprot:XP_020401721.1 uncharacterized protein LOC103641998 isoform X2 [Zea mays]
MCESPSSSVRTCLFLHALIGMAFTSFTPLLPSSPHAVTMHDRRSTALHVLYVATREAGGAIDMIRRHRRLRNAVMCESSMFLMSPSPSPSPPQPSRPPPEYKHFCRVCNKGFTCGSALGGHMRAHGASDVDGFGVDDDDSLDEEPTAPARCTGADQWDVAGTSSATHAYALRANPNRLIRSCQVCKNCGKEFTSWDLFLQHGKCNSSEGGEGEEGEMDGSDSLRSSLPASEAGGGGEEDPAVAAAAWSKGKRSRRVVRTDDPSSTMVSAERCTSGDEDEELANFLVMLSSSKSNNNDDQTIVITADHHKEPVCASTGEGGGGGEPLPFQSQTISLFTQTQTQEPVVPLLPSTVAATVSQYIAPISRGVFECKACKKVFTSHQALGGHRASHKKVKGCFAARFDNNATETAINNPTIAADTNSKAVVVNNADASVDAATRVFAITSVDTDVGTSNEATSSSLSMAHAVPIRHNPASATTTTFTVAAHCKKNVKMHECSVCHRLFTSGQALGGHKRCHWLTSNTSDPCNPLAIPPLTEDLVVGEVKHHDDTLQPTVDATEPLLDLTIAANPAVALAASTMRPDIASTVHLKQLVVAAPSNNVSHRKKTAATGSHTTDAVVEEDEADSIIIKKAKISDLKDVVNMDGESTQPWLQVGIGSSSARGDDG